jgi:hypothetical protein
MNKPDSLELEVILQQLNDSADVMRGVMMREHIITRENKTHHDFMVKLYRELIGSILYSIEGVNHYYEKYMNEINNSDES